MSSLILDPNWPTFRQWSFGRVWREECEGLLRVDNPGEWCGFQRRRLLGPIPLTPWRLAGVGLHGWPRGVHYQDRDPASERQS